MKTLEKVMMVAAGVAAGGAMALAAADERWRRDTGGIFDNLDERPIGRPAPAEDVDNLPEPVARYLRYAVPEQRAPIRLACCTQEGGFRTDPVQPWAPLTAEQHFRPDLPAFVWDARIKAAPLPAIHVRDSYIAGAASMRASVGGLAPIVSIDDSPPLAEAALQRLLAELPWLPTALAAVAWEPIDNSRARALLFDNGVTASLEFAFAPDGRLLHTYTPSRYRFVDGRPEPTPWACHYRDWEQVEGVTIPTSGEAEWLLPGGDFPYCRLRIRSVNYT